MRGAAVLCALLLASCSVDLLLGSGVAPCPAGEVRSPTGVCTRAIVRVELPGQPGAVGVSASSADYVLEVGAFADDVDLVVHLSPGSHVSANGMPLTADADGTVAVSESTDAPTTLVVDGPSGDRVTSTVSFTHALSPVEAYYVKAPRPGAADAFGSATAVTGRFLVVGAPFEDSRGGWSAPDAGDDSVFDAGAAYVYRFEGSTLVPEQLLKGDVPVGGDRFGTSVAVAGTTLAVGCPGCDGSGGVDQGAVFVFERVGVRWTLAATLRASNAGARDGFGSDVALSGDTLVVGAPGESSASLDPTNDQAPRAGAAYVFRRGASGFAEVAYLKASNADAGDVFGSSVAAGPTFLVVGAPGEDGGGVRGAGDASRNTAMDSGAAYVFAADSASGFESAYVKGDFAGVGDALGADVATFGELLAFGAPSDDRVGTEALGAAAHDDTERNNGAAYVYGGSVALPTYLACFDTTVPRPYLEVGASLAGSASWLVVGVPGEDAAEGGIDPPLDAAGEWQGGAVYVVGISTEHGSERHVLRSSSQIFGRSFDRLGASVAFGGGWVVAGSPYEDGSSAGVGGDPNALGIAQSGAVFIWR